MSFKYLDGVVVVEMNSQRFLLMQAQLFANLVPKLTTVSWYFRGCDAIENNDAIRGKDGEHFRHDFLEMTTVSANKNCIRR